jgi:hypothetical protein
MKEAAHWGEALLLLRMQGAFLCFVLLDQFVDAFSGALVIYVCREPPVVINLLVDLNALFAHLQFPHSRVYD